MASVCLTGAGLKYLFDIDTPDLVEQIVGLLTNTPGLAAADSITDSSILGVVYTIVGVFTEYP